MKLDFASQNKEAKSSPRPEGLGFCFAKQGGFDMYDVAIIGAGVVGSAIARELSKYQVNA